MIMKTQKNEKASVIFLFFWLNGSEDCFFPYPSPPSFRGDLTWGSIHIIEEVTWLNVAISDDVT